MNLLPAPDVSAPKPRRVSRRSALLAAILVGALGLYGAVTIRDGWEVRRLRSEVAALGPRVEEVHDLQRELNQLRSQTDAVEAVVGSRFSPLETLKELTLVVPNSAWLTESSFDGRKLLIGGYADSSQELIGPLEESPLFTNIQFQGTITKRNDKERFKISAEME
jgi:general secretion pathway protein L